MREWVYPAAVLLVVTLALSLGARGRTPSGEVSSPRRVRHKPELGVVSDMLIGADGRWSTSKTMFTLWTYAVGLVLLSILFMRNAAAISDNGIDGTYLFLLGFPVGGAVIAKQLTLSSITNGDLFKKDGTPSGNPLIDLTGDDTGRLDLGDFQYVLFNAITVGYFIYLYHHAPAAGLPKLPSTLVLLVSVSASAYLGKKALAQSEGPVIVAVSDHAGNPKDQLFLMVAHLVDPTKPLTDAVNAAVVVIFTPTTGGAENTDAERAVPPAGNLSGSNDLVRVNFTVPADLSAGAYSLRVGNYLGVRSEPMVFHSPR